MTSTLKIRVSPVFDVEGLISSPFGDGRTKDILDVIDAYEKDFSNLSSYSNKYPTPAALRNITKQGELLEAPLAGVGIAADESEAFGVTEFALPVPEGFSSKNKAKMIFNGSEPPSIGELDGDVLRFRFSPRDIKVWPYIVKSDFPALDGKTGAFNAVASSEKVTGQVSKVHPNWWIDDQDPAVAEGVHAGAKSVSQWRKDILSDFAGRMLRCKMLFKNENP